jgi:hypothetical protein
MDNTTNKTTSTLDLAPELLNGISQLNVAEITSQTTSILDLPPELLDQIAGSLPLKEHGLCRLACRYLYTSTWSAYARKEVGELITDLSAKSLAQLEEVAQDPRRAPYVRKLVVCSNDAGPSSDQTPDGTQRPWMWEESTGQILPLQPNERQLEDILRRFSNCQSFYLSAVAPPTDSEKRFGRPPDFGDTVSIVLGILLRVNRQLKELQVYFPSDRSDSRALLDAPGGLPQFRCLYSNLEVLEFASEHPCPDNFLLDILLHAPKMRKLGISFGDAGSDTVSRLFTTPVPFQLQELELNEVPDIDGASLLEFIRHHSRTLKCLDLWDLGLDPAGPDWPTIFKSLATSLLCLELVDFSGLRGGGESTSSYFKFPGEDGQQANHFYCDGPFGEGKLCKAPSMKAVLEKIAGHTQTRLLLSDGLDLL